jgi:hypothetical protein
VVLVSIPMKYLGMAKVLVLVWCRKLPKHSAISLRSSTYGASINSCSAM